MKKYFCFFLAFVFTCVCVILPGFAADWFDSTAEAVTGYSVSFSDDSLHFSISGNSDFYNWLISVGAVSPDTGINCRYYFSSSSKDGTIWADTSSGHFDSTHGFGSGFSLVSLNKTFSSTDGLSLASSLFGSSFSEVTSVVPSDGFVNAGFNTIISNTGILFDFIIDNSTVLFCVCLSIGVTLVGWGISKIKNLVKGY